MFRKVQKTNRENDRLKKIIENMNKNSSHRSSTEFNIFLGPKHIKILSHKAEIISSSEMYKIDRALKEKYQHELVLKEQEYERRHLKMLIKRRKARYPQG